LVRLADWQSIKSCCGCWRRRDFVGNFFFCTSSCVYKLTSFKEARGVVTSGNIKKKGKNGIEKKPEFWWERRQSIRSTLTESFSWLVADSGETFAASSADLVS
jgi:hypothetical protein